MIRALKSFLALAGLLVVACGPQWSTAHYSPGIPGRMRVCLWLPPQHLASAHNAIDAWDAALHKWNAVVPLDNPSDTNACTILVRTQADPLYDRSGDAQENVLAWCACIGCRSITLRTGHYESDVSGILQHELGHALGAQHADGTLMDPYWHPRGYTCPDRETVLQVAAWNRIDEDQLSWCKP